MAKLYRYTFEVIQTTPMMMFPIDMLRYDDCRPCSERDSGLITEYSQTGTMFGKDVREPIKLYSLKHGWPKWMPTTARWQSFGWKVKVETIKREAI